MGEILLWILFGVACYFLGRASMLRTVVKMVAEEAQDEVEQKVNNEPGDLFVEKINNIYYAYVGQKFAGQSSDLNELFDNMKTVYKINTFKITHIEGISKDEGQQMAEAIAKIYHINPAK